MGSLSGVVFCIPFTTNPDVDFMVRIIYFQSINSFVRLSFSLVLYCRFL
jgi:hypothetical protein